MLPSWASVFPSSQSLWTMLRILMKGVNLPSISEICFPWIYSGGFLFPFCWCCHTKFNRIWFIASWEVSPTGWKTRSLYIGQWLFLPTLFVVDGQKRGGDGQPSQHVHRIPFFVSEYHFRVPFHLKRQIFIQNHEKSLQSQRKTLAGVRLCITWDWGVTHNPRF